VPLQVTYDNVTFCASHFNGCNYEWQCNGF